MDYLYIFAGAGVASLGAVWGDISEWMTMLAVLDTGAGVVRMGSAWLALGHAALAVVVALGLVAASGLYKPGYWQAYGISLFALFAADLLLSLYFAFRRMPARNAKFAQRHKRNNLLGLDSRRPAVTQSTQLCRVAQVPRTMGTRR
jgi:hypothetical protein